MPEMASDIPLSKYSVSRKKFQNISNVLVGHLVVQIRSGANAINTLSY